MAALWKTLLNDTYEELDLLPPHAPEWETAVPEFVEQLTALMRAKEQVAETGGHSGQ